MRNRIRPKLGQESVWDYPRPPKLEPSSKTVRIEVGGEVIAQSNRSFRVLETSHPPVYYIPQDDIKMQLLVGQPGKHSFCEWKGRADYWNLIVGDLLIPEAAWSYPSPTDQFARLQNYLAFYPSKMDTCYVDNELVQAQEGDFYGGWITSDIVGPFKGGSGTWGW